MAFFLVLGIPALLMGAYCLLPAIRSKNPNNLISTVGELTKQKSYKNFKTKNGTIPNATEYAYTYSAEGKSYVLRGLRHTHPRNIPKRVVIVYLRGFPRCAYQDHFSGVVEWLLAISLLVMGVFCTSLYFMVR